VDDYEIIPIDQNQPRQVLLYGTFLASAGLEWKVPSPIAKSRENSSATPTNGITRLKTPAEQELIEGLKKALELRGESKSPLFIISL
jgi:hypothetical protein